eukprot:gene17263-22795_t
MMGLQDFSYWASYFISDGVIIGFLVSFLCTLASTYGLFNNANFGTVLGLLFSYTLSGTAFAFFLCTFFDSPQTSGQLTLLVLLGFYVIYIACKLGEADIPTQTFCCLFPPLALQIGSGAFLNSYQGISIQSICGIMFADIFIYSLLAWYISQVRPTSIGVAKPWYFIFKYDYWLGPKIVKSNIDNKILAQDIEIANKDMNVPVEVVNKNIFGEPTIRIEKLRKLFGSQVAVNNIDVDLYENQIFALLGHNGAGKTTTINMLTGLISPDYGMETRAHIYGSSIETDMQAIRRSMGVCPQHDVLFEHLTVREHILLTAQLKGFSYEMANEEAVKLTTLFHLDKRLDHTGSELSGGQKRKLSVAMAVSGGSKFVVLDEPTAGMDPLARRELWDLLASLRIGRTMLLTTHYMDEADILGDRVAIMSLGTIQCCGTPQFLKTKFGSGYKLIFDKATSINNSNDNLNNLTNFIKQYIPNASYESNIEGSHVKDEVGAVDEGQITYILPFDSIGLFGNFFEVLNQNISKFQVSNYGITITSLEDVFLKIGEDSTVTPKQTNIVGIGSDRSYEITFLSQVLGITYRRLNYAANDFVTIALIGLPICVAIVNAALYSTEVISNLVFVNDLVCSAIYMGGYLGIPGLLAEFIVKERANKLRNVLTVMGCDFKAYCVQGGILLWGSMILSPHGALFSALLGTTQNFSSIISNYPPIGATLAIQIFQTFLYIGLAWYFDSRSVVSIFPLEDETLDKRKLDELEDDVKDERIKTEQDGLNHPLVVKSLRKLFPPKNSHSFPLTAVEDLTFHVEQGEIFGLLGANGAGKTTTLSMLTRHLIPTAGDAFLDGKSILTDFPNASKNLGVVTQNNSLWDLLTVESHLYLFARLRGVPEDLIVNLVEGTIDQLELRPHAKKLSQSLSGGMKRKLCVAIALIGDPKVVLLDEPSAGLDPVSRRNLWNVIVRTMSNRSVILTTHSMEEAEFLCKRIGIMVSGQLKALGTKQHLKVKYSSGYELVIKLNLSHVSPTDISKNDVESNTSFNNPLHLEEQLTKFLSGVFPRSSLISNNGGLLTYRIPKEEMNISKTFKELENHKSELNIENYSVSQPTLEQVFIRTVLDYTEKEALLPQPVFVPQQSGLITLMKLFWILGAQVSFLFAIGVIAFIVMVVGIIMTCCVCFQKKVGLDE